MQATCTRIMFPGESVPKRSAARAPGAPAQAGRARRRSSSGDSCHSQQAALPAEQRESKLPSPKALGASSPIEQKEGRLPSFSSISHTQRQVELSEQNSAMSASSPRCAGEIAMPRGIGRFRERQLPHSSADTASPACTARDGEKLFEHGLVHEEAQQKETPYESGAGSTGAALCGEKGHEEEAHLSTDASCLAGAEGKQPEEEPRLRDVSVSPMRSYSSAASSAYYSPTLSEPSQDSAGRDFESFTFPRPRPSQETPGAMQNSVSSL